MAKLPVFKIEEPKADDACGVQSIEIVSDPIPGFEFIIVKEDGKEH